MNNSPERPYSEAPREQCASLSACLIATAGYVGYVPFAPGTWGSLVGVLLYWLLLRHTSLSAPSLVHPHGITWAVPFGFVVAELLLFLSAIGIWAAEKMSVESRLKDPQFVVVDEVSGQMLTFLLALAPANWKYLLLGFILFRAFDIWKPFPARQAESLPGGWGIMADDWVAGVYAAFGLWIARSLGL
jgi:phosphatidylglycerophosphatase A